MEFFNSAVDTLQTIVVGLGGALCVWGGVNLLEGYGADNPASKSQGIKQLVGLSAPYPSKRLTPPHTQSAPPRPTTMVCKVSTALLKNSINLPP